MEEKSVNNGVYLTFISEPEMEMPLEKKELPHLKQILLNFYMAKIIHTQLLMNK